MQFPKIFSLNIASPARVSLDGNPKKTITGYFKKPVLEPIFLDYIGFDGDGVGDKRIHGGKDMAVCAYPIEHFLYWSKKLGRDILPSSFGENLSISGMIESEVHIGDIFKIGEAHLQISQPREPCHKINKVFKDNSMACTVKKTGFSGYYLRVIKTGLVKPDSVIQRIHKQNFSIKKANALFCKGGANPAQLQELLSLPDLSINWKKKTEKRLSQ
jgi:MOSC domain-containing protein YiiM